MLEAYGEVLACGLLSRPVDIICVSYECGLYRGGTSLSQFGIDVRKLAFDKLANNSFHSFRRTSSY